MAKNTKRITSQDIAKIESLATGVMCHAPSRVLGGRRLPRTFLSPIDPIYCAGWSTAEKRAYWTGYLGRMEEFAEDALGILEWIKDAFGFGDEDGDASKAWGAFF